MATENKYRWQWMQRLDERVYEKFENDYYDGWDYQTKSILVDFYFDDGSFIEVEMNSKNEVDVFIYHKNEDNERDCPNLEAYIIDNLPSWDEYVALYEKTNVYEDEWTSHGFRNEADYWKYRLG